MQTHSWDWNQGEVEVLTTTPSSTLCILDDLASSDVAYRRDKALPIFSAP